MKSVRILVIAIGMLLSFAHEVMCQYVFKNDISLEDTDIKSQGMTGTCWCFATVSFLESEVIRTTTDQPDLSEMFVVRYNYLEKARNYLLRQGKANFSEGSLSHDVIRIINEYGIVPESVYPGLRDGETIMNHSEMVSVLEAVLKGYLNSVPVSDKWYGVVNGILDAYLGPLPEEFTYKGKTYTPKSFAESINITHDKYVSITSFTHHPLYSWFVLEIPDNYSNGSYFNVPLDELTEVVDNSLANGYSIVWDGDVSDPGFNSGESIAILPAEGAMEDLLVTPVEERDVDQAMRQKGFESLVTTDDHLMHIVGTAHDEFGTKYYIVKNSWGNQGPAEGYIYMSDEYFRMNTISVTANENAIPKDILHKMMASQAY